MWLVGIGAMELVDEIWGVGEIRSRLPCPARDRPVFPVNKILQLAIADTRVQDFLDFKLFVVVDNNRRRWILDTAGDIVQVHGLEERHMEHGMDSHRRG
jgi:hypothetical protein